MFRDPQEDDEARAALNRWLIEMPEAAIVVAAINSGDDDALDVSLRVSRTMPYQLIGLIQALFEHAIKSASPRPGADRSPELDALLSLRAVPRWSGRSAMLDSHAPAIDA
jgi:hypothetical protein